jgi:hypothetical protein
MKQSLGVVIVLLVGVLFLQLLRVAPVTSSASSAATPSDSDEWATFTNSVQAGEKMVFTLIEDMNSYRVATLLRSSRMALS